MGLQKPNTIPFLLMVTDLTQKGIMLPTELPETAPSAQPRRQPLAPMRVGVDLGGTHTRAAVFAENGAIVARVRKVTPAEDGPDAVIGTIVSAIHEVLGQAEIGVNNLRGIGISAPGPLNPRTGVVYQAPNLRGWRDIPLAAAVKHFFATSVFVGHDATLAALAEFTSGAGVGTKDMIYLTVSTGIGGGIIANGMIIDGLSGTAGEVGHMYLDTRPDAPVCGAGHPGCLEALASGTAIARDATALVAAGRGEGIASAHQARIAQLQASDRAEERHMAARDVVTAARNEDSEALDLLTRAGEVIGYGCVNLAHALNPQRIVIGGGVANAGELLFVPIRAVLGRRAFARTAEETEIVAAALADDGGLIGAAAYVDYMLQRQH